MILFSSKKKPDNFFSQETVLMKEEQALYSSAFDLFGNNPKT